MREAKKGEEREREGERESKSNRGEKKGGRGASISRWERVLLLSKYKVKWQRIYAGIKVQLFGTICIT